MATEKMCLDCGNPLKENSVHEICRMCSAVSVMHPYKNLAGNSGIIAYQSGNYYINILFRGFVLYRYTKTGSGYETIRTMQRLAREGWGLCRFISSRKPGYIYKEIID